MLQNLEKFGYFMVGASVGIFVASKLYDAELSKPIGDIEPYDAVKSAIDDISDAGEELVEKAADYANKAIDEIHDEQVRRKREFNELRREMKNVKNDYKAMFKGSGVTLTKDESSIELDGERIGYSIGDTKISEIANDIADKIIVNDDAIDDIPQDDVLPDVEKEDDTEYVKERVEEWIEVYLGENPQDPISLVYYAGDMTLCDDREQLIANADEVVGMVALERLVNAGPGAENGVIYVRNLKTMIDYEVVLDPGKYGETVLGIFESNLEKEDGGDASI